ncbi:GSCOCT00004200001.3-RA-CDS [Cotesia congregata]|uniref:Odorant receptor n=1 Tax=Cotesia congregata TaxID=51543 RepID=A0A8J2HR73_COTCN|nr:GSCOCT00004200001.3-RA-CDS [Cotesia congregata]CAG5109154.1 olfactory receptor 98 [Cotesia congregata]
MSKSKLAEYIAYENLIRLLLSTIGLWSPEESSLFCRSIIYLQMSTCILPFIGVFNFFRTNFTNVSLATKSFSLLASYLTVIVKGFAIVLNRKDVKDLRKMLVSHYNNLIRDPKMTNIVLDQITTFRRLSYVAIFFVVVACMSYIIIPIIFIISQLIRGADHIKYILPFPTIYNWEIPPNGFRYRVHFLTESFAIFSIILITIAVDNLYSLHVFQIIGFLREISYRMKHFHEDNDDKGSSDLVVRRCVFQYGILIASCRKLQRIYGPIILWTMGTNAVILCAVTFQLSQMSSISIGRIILFTAYAGVKLIQVFIYAWAGTRLTAESEDCRAAYYAANWVGNKSFMRNIIIMLAQKPLILTACNYSIVSVEMFGSVLNTTASYFLLLNTFDEA